LEDKLTELLTKKLAGEASASELVELNTLLTTYPDASDTEDIFTRIWQSPVEVEDTATSYQEHMKKYGTSLGRLHRTHPSQIGESQPPVLMKQAVVVMLVVALMITCAFLFFRRANPERTAHTQIITGKGMRKQIVLPDGTKVLLNGDSRLSFDPAMKSGDTRLVNLSGEAFFDVAHDAVHPFVIHTRKVSITALGTVFNVMAYPDEKKCETTLIQGSVELTVNNDSKQKITLKPLEKVAVTDPDNLRAGTTLLIEHVNHVMVNDRDYVPETSWTDNKLVFENETLERLTRRLERWYDARINIANSEIAQFRFTGSFARETIEQALAILQTSRPFKIRTNESGITIY
jgi:transmembrane sensor